MLIAKKRVLSFIFLIGLATLQVSTLIGVTPVRADDTLLNQQGLLTEVGDSTYGAKPLDVKVIALNFLETALGFLAFIFLALFVFAGFKWMTSAGNEENIKKATSLMTSAVIGLVIVLASWGITKYIIKVTICSVDVTNGSCASLW